MKKKQKGYHRTSYDYFAFTIMAFLFLELIEYFEIFTDDYIIFIIMIIYILIKYFIVIEVKKDSLVILYLFSQKKVILFNWIEDVSIEKILWMHYLRLKLKKSIYYIPLNLKNIDLFWDDIKNTSLNNNKLKEFAINPTISVNLMERNCPCCKQKISLIKFLKREKIDDNTSKIVCNSCHKNIEITEFKSSNPKISYFLFVLFLIFISLTFDTFVMMIGSIILIVFISYHSKFMLSTIKCEGEKSEESDDNDIPKAIKESSNRIDNN